MTQRSSLLQSFINYGCKKFYIIGPLFHEPKLELITNLKCDQIYKVRRYDFGHTSLGYLSPS